MASFKQDPFEAVQPATFRPEGETSAAARLVQGLSPLAAKAATALRNQDLKAAENQLEGEYEKIGNAVAFVDNATAAGATFDKDSGEILTDVGQLTPELRKQYETVINTAGDTFRSIASATAQGALPANAAALHTESELKRMINEHPGFAPELRSLARDLAGYDPGHYTLRQILKTRQPASRPKTVEDEWRERADALTQAARLQGKMDITSDQFYVLIARDEQLKMQQSIANNRLKMNEISASDWLQTYRSEIGPKSLDFLAHIAKTRIENNGIMTPEMYDDALRKSKETARTEVYTHFVEAGQTLSFEARKKIDDEIDFAYKDLNQAIKDNSFTKILTDKIEKVVLADKMWGITATRDLSRFTNAHGERITSQVLDMMANFANPAQFELFAKNFPALKILLDNKELTTKDAGKKTFGVIDKILQGTPLNEEDLAFRAPAEKVVLDLGDKDMRNKFFAQMGADAPLRGVKWLSNAGERARATPQMVKFMKQEFQTNYDEMILGIADRLNKAGGDLRLIQADDGTIKALGTYSRKGATYEMPTSDFNVDRLNVWLKAINNGWSADLGVNKSTFVHETMKTITQARDDLKQSKEEEEK